MSSESFSHSYALAMRRRDNSQELWGNGKSIDDDELHYGNIHWEHSRIKREGEMLMAISIETFVQKTVLMEQSCEKFSGHGIGNRYLKLHILHSFITVL